MGSHPLNLELSFILGMSALVAFAAMMAGHYALSWDRIDWLLRR